MCTASLIGDLINFLLANIISCKIVVKEIQLQNSLTRENCFICVLGVVLYLNSELFLQMGGFQRRHSISEALFFLKKEEELFPRVFNSYAILLYRAEGNMAFFVHFNKFNECGLQKLMWKKI